VSAGPLGAGERGGVAEKRNDAKVTREYELARPAELDADQSAIGPYFAKDIRDRYGAAVGAATHAPMISATTRTTLRPS